MMLAVEVLALVFIVAAMGFVGYWLDLAFAGPPWKRRDEPYPWEKGHDGRL